MRGQTGAGEAARLKTGSGTLAEKAGRGRPAVGGVSRRLERPPAPAHPPPGQFVTKQSGHPANCRQFIYALWRLHVMCTLRKTSRVSKNYDFSWKSEPIRGRGDSMSQGEHWGAAACSAADAAGSRPSPGCASGQAMVGQERCEGRVGCETFFRTGGPLLGHSSPLSRDGSKGGPHEKGPGDPVCTLKREA